MEDAIVESEFTCARFNIFFLQLLSITFTEHLPIDAFSLIRAIREVSAYRRQHYLEIKF